MNRLADNQAAQFYGAMPRPLCAATWAALAALCPLAGCASRVYRVRLNQAQVIGTHN